MSKTIVIIVRKDTISISPSVVVDHLHKGLPTIPAIPPHASPFPLS